MQVMGGARITLHGLTHRLRPAAGLADQLEPLHQARGPLARPPTDVVCVDCSLGGSAAHTASIQESVRSGLVDSTLCAAKYSKLTLTSAANAVDPVDVRNAIGTC